MSELLKAVRLSIVKLRAGHGKELLDGLCIVVTLSGQVVGLMTPLTSDEVEDFLDDPDFLENADLPAVRLRDVCLWFSREKNILLENGFDQALITTAVNNGPRIPVGLLNLFSEDEATSFDSRLTEVGHVAIDEFMGWNENFPDV